MPELKIYPSGMMVTYEDCVRASDLEALLEKGVVVYGGDENQEPVSREELEYEMNTGSSETKSKIIKRILEQGFKND